MVIKVINMHIAGADPGFRAKGVSEIKLGNLACLRQSRATKCCKPEINSFISFVFIPAFNV